MESTHLESGSIINGQYELIRPLGSGGMGEVWSAWQINLQRKVALKFLHTELMNNQNIKKRVLSEGRLLATLDHHNVIKIIDCIELEYTILLVLEYIEDGCLTDYMTESQLSLNDSIELILSVLEGLSVVHQKGILHRDLKPDNILIKKSLDGKLIPKLTDFGIALDTQTQERITRMNVAIGTPEYMSPEQIMCQALDVRSDLYSMGIIIYELLSGQLPFNGNTYEINHGHVSQEPNYDLLPPSIKPNILPVLQKTLAKPPSDRYHTCTELLNAIKTNFKGDYPTPIAPPNLPPQSPLISNSDQAQDIILEMPHPHLEQSKAKTAFWILGLLVLITAATLAIGNKTDRKTKISIAQQPKKESTHTDPLKTELECISGNCESFDQKNDKQANEYDWPEPNFCHKCKYSPKKCNLSTHTICQEKQLWRQESKTIEAFKSAKANGYSFAKSTPEKACWRKLIRKTQKCGNDVECIHDSYEFRTAYFQSLSVSSSEGIPCKPYLEGYPVIYKASISQKDHVTSSGKPLNYAALRIVQDRANYHRFNKRDQTDQWDLFFGRRSKRRWLETKLNKKGAISQADRKRIMSDSTCEIEVTIWADDVLVRVID